MSSAPMAPSPPSVIKDRRLRFLIWQSISTVSVYLFSSLLHLRLGHFSLSDSLLSFLALHAFLLLLSSSFLLLLSPCPAPAASLPELSTTLRKSAFKWAIGGFPRPDFTVDSVSRAWRSLKSIFFLVVCVVAGIFSVVAACWDSDEGAYSLRLRGAVFGLVYGAYYLASKRWILKFPIIQRPLFYSFKKYFYSSFTSALKMSVRCHHLLQVVHTRRCIFAPPQGSAAAETNHSETLLEVLEQSPPKSLLQHLAYLDLCIVSENNTEQWRRAAFFEESGETYRQVIRACLRPIENFTSKLVEGLEGRYGDCSDLFLKQMSLPMDFHTYSKLNAAFDDYELCAWSSRSLAALTVCSRHEDRYKVAQLSSCNTAAVSTLLTALLAVEACLGKKTGGPSKQFLSPTSMKWATVEEQCELHNQAYAMADVLRASIYQIVSAFWVDMQASAKSMVLDKNWISEAKPLFGARSVLVQKLLDFLDYRAV
ncbi:Nucleoporin NDC1 [Rhynchospora pubera]|uniref:Nucleoporin NDC1 n=1 Tax=Rhynchospora pubera TaxID=906938 RepID=A0AAV8D984_9POAL|nr:Nucleoporin NDC1 [Rhynchospora pubera]